MAKKASPVCLGCGLDKDPLTFYKKSSAKDGLDSYCKICRRKRRTVDLANMQRIPASHKRCRRCSVVKGSKNFNSSPCTTDTLATYCKPCLRLISVLNTYGLSEDEYIALIAHGCVICGSHENLHIDHDHACCPYGRGCPQCVRGALCDPHNRGLGCFQDNPEYLDAGAAYLRSWSNP